MHVHRLFAYSVLIGLALVGITLCAASRNTPIGEAWWPSPWGADDQRGAANRLTPAKVREAARLVRDGRIYQLGHVYESGMPIAGKRHFSLTIPGSPTG